jgi:hypothetical protein
MKKQTIFTFRADDAQRDKIKEVVEERNTTVSSLILWALGRVLRPGGEVAIMRKVECLEAQVEQLVSLARSQQTLLEAERSARRNIEGYFEERITKKDDVLH